MNAPSPSDTREAVGALDRLVAFAEGRYPYSDEGSATEDFATVRAALSTQRQGETQ